MSIPIFENDKVQIVFGVGNKNDPYDEDDVVQLQLIANELTKIRKQRQAENTLRESEKKYRSLFENIDDFAYCRIVFDEQGNPIDFVYREINDAFERLTGLKREAVIGKRVTEAYLELKKPILRYLKSTAELHLHVLEWLVTTFVTPCRL